MSKPVSFFRPDRDARLARERGSAYLFVLFVLFVLSVVGLSLAVVTQSEVQIGSAEQLATRSFYLSDSGLRIQLANHLVNGSATPRTRAHGNELTFQQLEALGAQFREIVEVSPFYPIFSGPCNLCTVNQDADYVAVNHVVTSTGVRLATGAGETVEQTRRITSQMFAIQPWEKTIAALQEAGDLSTIRY